MTDARLFFRTVWIGICALSMLAQTRLLLGIPLAPGWLDGFVLGSAVFAYGFTHPDRRIKTGAWLAGLLGAGCFAGALLPWQEGPAIRSWHWASGIPVVLWLLYYGLRRPGNAGLRGVPMAKPIAVALAWGWVTVMLPAPVEAWGRAGGMLLGRSVFIFALALAYDLADLDYDRRHGLATLAGERGVHRTFRLIFSALVLAILCSGANVLLHVYDLSQALALCASLVISAVWLRFLIHNKALKDWQKVLVDALMPVQFLIVWLATCLKDG